MNIKFLREHKLSQAIFGILVIGVFAFVFGPNIYAQFTIQTGGTGYGYGYGYGVGYGDDLGVNSYRIDGADLTTYDYGYGYRSVIQLTISDPTLTLSKPYDGNTTAAVTAGTLSGVVSPDAVTVSAVATYDTASVGTGKTITVVYTLGGAEAANYTKPVDYTVSTGVITSTSSGGGGGSLTNYCSSVTYSDWQATCISGFQYRDASSRTPSGCTLTTAQNNDAKRTCTIITTQNGQEIVIGSGSENFDAFIAAEKALVTKVNKALSLRLSGRILLQVEAKGEAWYVYPVDLLRYFLARPADAFAIMRKLGLGVSEKDYNVLAKGNAPARLSGRILLRVQAHGEAYYVNPLDHKLYYMGRPADAFALMRKFGLGINNVNLRQIGVGILK